MKFLLSFLRRVKDDYDETNDSTIAGLRRAADTESRRADDIRELRATGNYLVDRLILPKPVQKNHGQEGNGHALSNS